MALVEYGNWVSNRFIYLPAALGVLFLASAFFLPLLLLAAVAFLLAASYFAYARYLFSPKGGDLQARVRQLVLDHLEWDGEGRGLDIGCGNGALAIMLAKKYHRARVTGIDFWGRNWEYSRSACEKNARTEGVADRLEFQKASASALPFEDGSFDAVVSNFTFHEVRDTKDKREVVREALRVLKKGGAFSFQDLFMMRAAYGPSDELLAEIRGWGVSKVTMVETRGCDFVPWALKLPFMLGTMAIIVGEK